MKGSENFTDVAQIERPQTVLVLSEVNSSMSVAIKTII